MAVVYKTLGQGLVGYAGSASASSIVYTVPAGKQAVISSINIYGSNTIYSYAGVAYAIHSLPSGVSVSSNSTALIVSAAPVATGDTVSYQLGVTLAAGESILLATTYGAYTAQIFGGEIT